MSTETEINNGSAEQSGFSHSPAVANPTPAGTIGKLTVHELTTSELSVDELTARELTTAAPTLPLADAVAGVALGAVTDAAVTDAAASTVIEIPRLARALRHRDFRLFWTGNFLSNIGTWMQNIAQGWLVLQLTNSAFWLGVVGFAARRKAKVSFA